MRDFHKRLRSSFNRWNASASTISRSTRQGRRRLLSETLEPRHLLAADGPQIDQIIINDDAAQRSSVTSIDVVFDSLVTIDSSGSPFQIRRADDGAMADVVLTQTDGADGRSNVRLEFASSSAAVDQGVNAETLDDGNYYFVIDADAVQDRSGNRLDGNADGHVGDHFVYQGNDLYRMYGDFLGDRSVGLSEFAVFRGRFGSVTTDPSYHESYDANADGRIGLLEFARFRQAFGQSMAVATAQSHQWEMGAGETRTLDLASGATGFDQGLIQVSMIGGIAVTAGDTVQTAAGMVTVGEQGWVELATTSDFDGTAGFTYTLFDSALTDTAEVDFVDQPIIQVEVGPGGVVTVDAANKNFDPSWPILGFFRDETRTTPDLTWQRLGISATMVGDDLQVTVAKGVAPGSETIRFLIDHPDGPLPGELIVTITEPEVEITAVSDEVTLQAGTYQVFEPLTNDSAIEIGATDHDTTLRLVGVSFDPEGTFNTSAVVDNVRATIRGTELVVSAATDATVAQTLYYQVDAGTTVRAIGQIDLTVTPFSASAPLAVVFVSGDQALAPLPTDTPISVLHGWLGSDPETGGDGLSIATQTATYAFSEGNSMLHFTRIMDQVVPPQSLVVRYSDGGPTSQYGYVEIHDFGDATLLRALELSAAEAQAETLALPSELANAGWAVDGLVASNGTPVASIVDGPVQLELVDGSIVATLIDVPRGQIGNRSYRLQLINTAGLTGQLGVEVELKVSGAQPTANIDTIEFPTTQLTGTIDVLSNDTDEDGADLRLLDVMASYWGTPGSVAQGDFGTLEIVGGQIFYTRTTGDSFGVDEFAYLIDDADGNLARGKIVVNTSNAVLSPDEIHVSHASVSTDVVLTNDLLLAGAQLIGLSTTDSDDIEDYALMVDGDSVNLSVLSTGVITSFVQNRPTPETFYYAAIDVDGKSYFGGRLNVVIDPVGEAATSSDDAIVMGATEFETTIDVLANDDAGEAGDSLTLLAVGRNEGNFKSGGTAGAYGQLTIESNELVYRRTDGTRSGTETFVYQALDSGGHFITATLSVQTGPPLLIDDVIDVPFGTETVEVDVLANDTLPAGFTLANVSRHPHRSQASGLESIQGDGWSASVDAGKIRFDWVESKPDNGVVYYSVVDSSGKVFGGGQLQWQMSIIGQPAVAVDERIDLAIGEHFRVLNVLANDDPGDAGETLSIIGVRYTRGNEMGTMAHGIYGNVTLVNGELHFERTRPGLDGEDQFIYLVQDSGGNQATATVLVDSKGVDIDSANVSLEVGDTISFDPLTITGQGNGSLLGVSFDFHVLAEDYQNSISDAEFAVSVVNDQIQVRSSGEWARGRVYYAVMDSDIGEVRYGTVGLWAYEVSGARPVAVDDDVAIQDGQFKIAIDPLANDDPVAVGSGLSLVGVGRTPTSATSSYGISGTSGNLSIVDGGLEYRITTSTDPIDETFYYTAQNDSGETDVAVIIITGGFDPFVADVFSVTVDQEPMVLDVLANDLFPEGTSVVGLGATNLSNSTRAVNDGGIVVALVDGNLMLEIVPNQPSTGTFTYGLRVPNGGYYTGEFTIDVTASLESPVLQNDVVTLAADQTLITIDVLANDDPGGANDGLELMGVAHVQDQPFDQAIEGQYGRLVVLGDEVIYQRTDGVRAGTESFVYLVRDTGGRLGVAEITVELPSPIMVEDQSTVLYGTSTVTVDLLANDNLPPGYSLHGLSVNRVRSGYEYADTLENDVWSATLVGDSIELQVDQFDVGQWVVYYSVADGSGNRFGGGQWTVDLSLAGNPATAVNDEITVPVGQWSVPIDVLGNDDAGDPNDPLEIVGVRNGGGQFQDLAVGYYGELSLQDGQFTYTRTRATGSGDTTFAYKIRDSGGHVAEATLRITYSDSILSGDAISIDFAAAPTDLDVLLNDNLPAGTTLTGLNADYNESFSATAVSDTAMVSIVSGQVRIESTEYEGESTFYYSATDPDGVVYGYGRLVVTTVPLGTAPVITNDELVIPLGGVIGMVDVLTNDDAGDAGDSLQLVGIKRSNGYRYESVANGSYGNLTIVGDQMVYQRLRANGGSESFDYQVVDQGGNLAVGQLRVTSENLLVADAVEMTLADADITFSPLANDAMPAGSTLMGVSFYAYSDIDRHNSVIESSGFKYSVVGSDILIEQAGGGLGDRFIYYAAEDPAGNIVFGGRIDFSVVPVGQPITVTDDDFTVPIEQFGLVIDVLVNDDSGDVGEPLTITGVSSSHSSYPQDSRTGSYGKLSLVDGELHYERTKFDIQGVDAFRYFVTDPGGNGAIGTLTVRTQGPLVVADELIVEVGAPTTTIDLLANDSLSEEFSLLGISRSSTNTISNYKLDYENNTHRLTVVGDAVEVEFLTDQADNGPSFYYAVQDSSGRTFTGTAFTVQQVTAGNPIAVTDDMFTLNGVNLSMPIDVTGNDDSGDVGEALTVFGVSLRSTSYPAHAATGNAGRLVLTEGALTYTRVDLSSTETDTFYYHVRDEGGNTAVGQVTITPDLSITTNDLLQVTVGDLSGTVDLLANDNLPAGYELLGFYRSATTNPILFDHFQTTSLGRLTVADDLLTIDQLSGQTGSSSFYYGVSNVDGDLLHGRVVVEVLSSDEDIAELALPLSTQETAELVSSSADTPAPLNAVSDEYFLGVDQTVGHIDVRLNDESGGQPFQIVGVGTSSRQADRFETSNGIVEVVDGELFYQRTRWADAYSQDSFYYRILGADGQTDVEQVRVIADTHSLETHYLTIDVDQSTTIDLLENDDLPSSWSFVGISADWSTSASDYGNEVITGDLHLTSLDGQLTVESLTGPIHNQHFYYAIQNANGQVAAVGQVIINVTATGNDIYTQDDDAVLPEGQWTITLDPLANDNPGDVGETLTIVEIRASSGWGTDSIQGRFGSLSLVGDQVVYTRNVGSAGGYDTFNYQVADDGQNSDSGRITINVVGEPTEVDVAQWDFDEPGVTVSPLANDSLPAGFSLVGISLSDSLVPSDYSLVASNPYFQAQVVGDDVAFTAIGHLAGNATFYYLVEDGDGNRLRSEISARLMAIGNPPFVSSDSFTFDQDEVTRVIDVIENDTPNDDSESLTITGISKNYIYSNDSVNVTELIGRYGILSLANNELSYTRTSPIAHGYDNFYYQVTDGGGHLRSESLRVVTQSPLLFPSTVSVPPGQRVIIEPALSGYQVVGVGMHNREFQHDVSLFYQDDNYANLFVEPNGIGVEMGDNWKGNTIFQYAIVDASGKLFTGSISVGLQRTGNVVQTQSDLVYLPTGELSVSFDPTFNDDAGDPDQRIIIEHLGYRGDTIDVGYGVFTLVDGLVDFRRTRGDFSGTAEVSYNVVDDGSQRDSSTIRVVINDTPMTSDYLYIAADSNVASVNPLNNDRLPAGSILLGVAASTGDLDAFSSTVYSNNFHATVVGDRIDIELLPGTDNYEYLYYLAQTPTGQTLAARITVRSEWFGGSFTAQDDLVEVPSPGATVVFDPTNNDRLNNATEITVEGIWGLGDTNGPWKQQADGKFGSLEIVDGKLSYAAGDVPIDFNDQFYVLLNGGGRSYERTRVTFVPPGQDPLPTSDPLHLLSDTIRGQVFADVDGNGVQGATELPLGDVEVRAVNMFGETIRRTRTDVDGKYELAWPEWTGAVQIEVTPPNGLAPTLRWVGNDASLDSDISPLSHRSAHIRWDDRWIDVGLAADSDGDGIADAVETVYGLSLALADDRTLDTDGDSLSDLIELLVTGTEPLCVDTDFEGNHDGIEFWLDENPFWAEMGDDGDRDRLRSLYETYFFGSHPWSGDTDDDDVADGIEYFTNGTNPLVRDTGNGPRWRTATAIDRVIGTFYRD